MRTPDVIWQEVKDLKTAELAVLKSLINREIHKRFDDIPYSTKAPQADEGRDLERRDDQMGGS